MKIPQTKRYSIYKNLVLQDERSKKLNFEPDGREHYVYRVTDHTRTEKEHYYGSHTPQKGKKYNSLEEEFWTYKTSSKYNVLNENKKENYKVKILKVFDNPADKIIYESFLHQYFNVKLATKFWNENNQGPFGFDNTRTTVVKDEEGNILWVDTTDERFLSGELVGINKGNKNPGNNLGKVACKDDKGNTLQVSKEEFSLNDNLVGHQKDTVTVIEIKTGETKRIPTSLFYANKDLYQGVQKGKKCDMTIRNKLSKKYNLFDRKGLIASDVLALDIRNIHRGLEQTSKENPLGSTRQSKVMLNQYNNMLLVGWYVELIKE